MSIPLNIKYRFPIWLLITSLLLLLSFSGFAKSTQFSETFNRCMDAGYVNADMANCYNAEIQRQEKRLNGNYRKYLSNLNSEVKNNFVKAQRSWIKYRDNNCDALASQEAGGTIAALIGKSCYLQMTKERADDFQR